MPMCHANSLYFAFTFTYLGATVRRSTTARASIPRHLLATIADAARHVHVARADALHHDARPAGRRSRRGTTSSRMRKLMISSAPARKDTKLAIMEHFRNSQLYELYGSTEAGWVTLLRPDEQIDAAGLGRPRVDRLGPGQDARRRRRRGARRRGRRALLVHAVRVRRLLNDPGEDGGSVPRRVVLQRRRHGAPRRARLLSISSTARAT